MYAQFRTFDLSKLPGVRKPVKPKRIPTPANLKTAFTSPWTIAHPQSLATFSVGVIACWDTHVCGLRPNADIKKVKDSQVHVINANEGYGYSEMVEGRSKLHLQKRGTRPWKVYRVCTCKDDHVSPPPDLQLDESGNPFDDPTWNTVCPVASMELLQIMQGVRTLRIYAKWFKTKGAYGGQNVGNVQGLANTWLKDQGVPDTFDKNSGRKTLGRRLELLHVPYKEHLHIHGDLETIWRNHYQGKLSKSGYRTREQSNDSDVATKALRRFATWLHDDDSPKPSVKSRLQDLMRDMDD